MNRYLKEFLHRGLMFGGFGPIVMGVIYYILSLTVSGFSIDGGDILCAIVSTYILAFLQAGASVFNQIEEWPLPKSLFFHFATIYLAYSLCYIINTWIPFEAAVLLIFTLIFIVVYFVVWIAVFLSIKAVSKRLNAKLQ